MNDNSNVTHIVMCKANILVAAQIVLVFICMYLLVV